MIYIFGLEIRIETKQRINTDIGIAIVMPICKPDEFIDFAPIFSI